MTAFIVVTVAAFLVLAFVAAPLAAWSVVVAALLAWLSLLAEFGAATNWTLGVLFAVAAVIANLPALRRAVFSDRVLAIYRKILPDMSPTEKDAIEAGTVWWDADLFSGKPDWDKLLAIPEPRLSPE